MKNTGPILLTAAVVVVFSFFSAIPAHAANKAGDDACTVACYYFPNYHPDDPRNNKLKGEGWSEWELVKKAKPRFEGHRQPRKPVWGYTDKSDPKDMKRIIKAAADHGIDAFVFDWYFYNDGPFLQGALRDGFLKAPNNDRMKFALMWANHDWIDIHPYRRGDPRTVLYPGKVTPETFDRICDRVIQDYFTHPCYWKIDGRPYFSIYHLNTLMESFGSLEKTRAALDRFRQKVKDAGLPGLHLNAVVWGRPVLPGEGKAINPSELVQKLGFDSVTSYVWVHHVGLPKLETPYDFVQEKYFDYWKRAENMFDVPYYPNVTMGWDPSPRTVQDTEYGNFGYPYTNTISNNTPEQFRRALQAVKERLSTRDENRILNINAWNEWTEGSYLEPDKTYGTGYLKAIQKVFGD